MRTNVRIREQQRRTIRKYNTMATATATKTNATPKLTKSGKPRAARTPSAFAMKQRLNVAYHGEVDGQFNLGSIIEQAATANGLAVRIVQRTRKPRKAGATTVSGPATITAYVAPKGYEFKSAAARGIRVSDAATADALRALSAQLGVSVDDVIRAALAKLSPTE